MKYHITYLCITTSLLIVSAISWAQTATRLPLQPHKIQYAQEVERDALATNDSSKLAEAYYLYGKTYEASGDILTAKQYFIKSLRIQEQRGDSDQLARLYYWLFSLAANQLAYVEANTYVMREKSVAQRLGTTKSLVRLYGDLMRLYSTDWSLSDKRYPKPNPDSALYYHKKRELYTGQSRNPLDQITFYLLLSSDHRTTNPAKALRYLKVATTIARKQREYDEEVRILFHIVDIYFKLRQLDTGFEYLQQAEKLQATRPANKQNSIEGKQTVIVFYHEYYRQKGNWQQAYKYQQQVYELQKQRLQADRNGALSRLNIEYETEKKVAQLNQQAKELTLRNENLKNQQRFLMAMGALLLITIGMSIVFFRLYRKNQRTSRRNAQLVKEQNHRVKNNLQVVSSLLSLQSNRLSDEVAQKAVEESQLRVETMAILHRKLYDGDGLVVVNLPEFISELAEGVLQTFGYGGVTPEFAIAPIELSADQALPIGLIVNELLTNVCKYAFPDNPNPTLLVAARQIDKQINLTIADNGPGFMRQPLPDMVKNPPKSFGLRLIQMQVEQLRGTYYFLPSAGQGTSFTMSFTV